MNFCWKSLAALCLLTPMSALSAPKAVQQASQPAGAKAKRVGHSSGAIRPKAPGAGASAAAVSRPTPAHPVPAELANPAIRSRVLAHPLLQRLSTVSGTAQFRGVAKGAARHLSQALPQGGVAFTLPTPRGLIQGFGSKDGKTLWIAGAMLRDRGAILRLGDLLPLVQPLGVTDRELSLGVRSLQVGAGSPPSYGMTFRPGLLWKIREQLAAAAKSGRILYSLTMGRVTVLGAYLVAAGREGSLSVKLVSPAGEQTGRIKQLMIPRACRALEMALRSAAPGRQLALARKKLAVPSMTQACAARYVVLAARTQAPRILRAALRKGRLARPFDVVEALAFVAPAPDKANLDAVMTMIRKMGTVGADAACKAAPLTWVDALLNRPELDPATRAVFTRCAWH